jgi:hypothetical protein
MSMSGLTHQPGLCCCTNMKHTVLPVPQPQLQPAAAASAVGQLCCSAQAMLSPALLC